MEAKLNKIKHNFVKIKDIRLAAVNIFSTLEVKITKLKSLTNDFIQHNQETLFVFGLDSFKFQSKMIDLEYIDMQKYFSALNNRMYCEYYKLYKIVSEYIETTIGLAQNKTFEMIKANSKFPIYKDLEPYKQYNFETIEEVHKTIISLLNGIHEYIVLKDAELDTFKMKQYSGFNINNFVNTFDFNIIIVKQKLTLFMSYLEFFHNIHTKHFKRFSKKMKLMDDHINDDIQFDDSPRRKNSNDFDDSSSDGGSSTGGGAGAAGGAAGGAIEAVSKPAAVPRKSFMKKGAETVITNLKVFGHKPKTVVDLTNNNVNLAIVDEIEDDKTEDNKTENNELVIANLSEVNIAAISRERSETISKQLTEDPKMVTKMFDELTKTFASEEKILVKSVNEKPLVNEGPLVNEEEQPNILEVEVEDGVKDEISTETVVTESDDMLNDVNLNNPNAQNKKKRKAKKK
jgi:hypothetical protein